VKDRNNREIQLGDTFYVPTVSDAGDLQYVGIVTELHPPTNLNSINYRGAVVGDVLKHSSFSTRGFEVAQYYDPSLIVVLCSLHEKCSRERKPKPAQNTQDQLERNNEVVEAGGL
jgi:hypothetical protein